MATKRAGDSCYNKAEDDEPIFVLRATDKFAPQVIRYWTALVVQGAGLPTPDNTAEKVNGAHECANAMDDWQEEHPDKVKIPD